MALAALCLHSSGEINEVQLDPQSLEELGRTEPEGIYTITRTYKDDHAVLLSAHLDRLEESARIENIPLNLDRANLRRAIRTLLATVRYQEARVRISISRENPGRILVACEALKRVPTELRRSGVSVATHLITRPNPQAKTNIWENLRAQAREELPDDIFEGIVRTEDGILLEGFSSNFYAIMDGTLRTSDSDILEGVARRIVLQVCERLLPLKKKAICLSDLHNLSEAFLTSSSRGVVPIVMIDEISIHDGIPGPFTVEIIQRFDAWVDSHLEPI